MVELRAENVFVFSLIRTMEHRLLVVFPVPYLLTSYHLPFGKASCYDWDFIRYCFQDMLELSVINFISVFVYYFSL